MVGGGRWWVMVGGGGWWRTVGNIVLPVEDCLLR